MATIVFGSYERLLYGLKLAVEESSKEVTLTPSFRYPAHLSTIKCVAGLPKLQKKGHQLLATGGLDEQIKLYDLTNARERGHLANEHEGSITGLAFDGKGDLVSVGEDGKLALWRCRDGELIGSKKGHKGKINTLHLHPQHPQLAFTTASDKSMVVWDLLNITRAANKKLDIAPDCGAIGPSFLYYGHTSGITRYHLTGERAGRVACPSRVHSLALLSKAKTDWVLAGCEDGTVHLYRDTLEEESPSASFQAHDARVKVMLVMLPWLVTASSDGTIKVWSIESWSSASEKVASPSLAAEHRTGLRLTSGTLIKEDGTE